MMSKKRGVASTSPLARSRSNIPNPPAHCAKRRNSAERCSADSPLLAEAQGSAYAFAERIELVRSLDRRGIRIGEGSERFAQGADAARHLGRRGIRPQRHGEGQSPGHEPRRESMPRCDNEQGRYGPQHEQGRYRHGDQFGANRPTFHASSQAHSGRSPSRHLSAGSGVP